ncbi:fimbrial biogenesis chaperone [Variovorax sp.]|jgi:fimbrial chaperone protein|uniref:fimbrial biogenesis chaperone n=1 Tax=Variovorax sp. TaxID=1871043 RepID=UPI0025E0863B|nr:molecular chaperone [Variovorax sp.]
MRRVTLRLGRASGNSMLFKNALRSAGVTLMVVGLLGAHIAPADAAVMLGGTRVILHEKDREASISMKNESGSPYVVQAWIDAGEGKNKTPFLVTPPLSRLDPGVENILRVLRTSKDLPADRESAFWLNVKEIPEKAQEDNVLQIAVRTRIKLFYRPTALRDSDPAAARNRLKWAIVAGQDGKGAALKIVNPTPYHVTFTYLHINGNQQEIIPDMLPPMEERIYPLNSITEPQAVSVKFTTINDFGGQTPQESVRVPAANEPVELQPQAAATDKRP